MVTFKQLEALYWISTTGNFEAAASKLNMSQSAISKRVHELEQIFGAAIFDRTKRSARLTEKGRELLVHATELLEGRDRLVENLSDDKLSVRCLRLGVTELTALTWLPALVESIRARFPRIEVELSVEFSSALYNKLERDHLDLIIAPDIHSDARFVALPLKSVENVWMASPRLIEGKTLEHLADLAPYTLLTQCSDSGTGLIYERWLAYHNIRLARTIISPNLLVQIGMTVAGLGISYLPKQCLGHMIDMGVLCPLDIAPGLPRVQYAALYRADRERGIGSLSARLATASCSFSTLIMAPFVSNKTA